MASTYTGSAAGGSLASAIQISIPQDGVDTLAVSTVNTALQKIADYIDSVRLNSNSMGLPFTINSGNAPPTQAYAWAYAGTSVAAPLGPAAGGSAVGQTKYLIAQAGNIRALKILTAQLTAGGTITISLNKNGGSVASLLVAAGTAAGTLLSMTGLPIAVAAGDVIDLYALNNAGLTAGIGISACTMVVAF